MYIGLLEKKKVEFFHSRTDEPFAPDIEENGSYKWDWMLKLFDVPFDMKITLSHSGFIGCLSLNLSTPCVQRIEVIVNGKIEGSYSAERGKLLSGDIVIPIGAVGDEVTARIYPCYDDICISNVDVLGAHDNGEPFVWPIPKNIEFGNNYLQISAIKPFSDDVDEIYAANFLVSRLTEKLGGDFLDPTGECVVIKKERYEGERYTVKASAGEIILSGASRLTMLYAVDTLVQVATRDGVLEFTCDDKPEKELRGFHGGLPSLENFEFMRRFFRYVLLPLRYNMVFIQVSGGMQYDRHPEINEGYASASAKARAGELPGFPHQGMIANGTVLTKEQVREYISYARDLGFEIVPEVQSLAHVQYITYAHPEIAEIDDTVTSVDDERAADAPPPSIYQHNYCPSLERSYEIIFDILDEVIEVFKPERYVHIGHDEVYKIGVCKRCRNKNPSDLFYNEVMRLYEYIKAKGLKTVMWADMLHPAPITEYLTSDRRAEFPKDILMLDFIWYFHFDKDIENDFLPLGFKVAVGNLYSSHFPRYRSRITKDNMIGGQLSTWLKLDEVVLAENGKMWDAIMLSEMLWNATDYDERNRTSYTHVMASRVQPEMRDNLRGVYSPEGYEKTEIPIPASSGELPPKVKLVCPEAVMLGEDEIAVGAKYKRLIFEHATDIRRARIVWRAIPTLGEYLVEYADGETLSVPLHHASNILSYDYIYGEPMPHAYYRHNGYVGTWLMDPVVCGKDYNGESVTFGAFVWENPRPDVEIRSVSYRQLDKNYIGVMLRRLYGCNTAPKATTK